MSQFYLACELGRRLGRVWMGTLHKEQLTVSEVRRFDNAPLESKGGSQWNIAALYHEVVEGLRSAGAYEEPIHGISCTSWAGDYLLFDPEGSLLTPTFDGADPRFRAGLDKVLGAVSLETVYGETGIQQHPGTTWSQLASESSKRLKRAAQLLPIADGFNYLLSGVARFELSMAGQTQLYQPMEQAWSERLLKSVRLEPKLLPEVVPAGTVLGPLRSELAKETKLDEAQVVASCSDELAATLAGLPVTPGQGWAYLRLGPAPLMGVPLGEPLINDLSRELGYSHGLGFGGAVCFQKLLPGLQILDECQDFWEKDNRQLDGDLLVHLAGSATPFESLINPADPRFAGSGDMPLKIQAFCKATGQVVPRKPGPVFRCILESLALCYRKALVESEHLTGVRVARLYVLEGGKNSLLSHFIANAIERPVVIVGNESAAIGNVAVQALALCHVESFLHARAIVSDSFKTETLNPHAASWDHAYDRFLALLEMGDADPSPPSQECADSPGAVEGAE
jgi:rhamnulokinase